MVSIQTNLNLFLRHTVIICSEFNFTARESVAILGIHSVIKHQSVGVISIIVSQLLLWSLMIMMIIIIMVMVIFRLSKLSKTPAPPFSQYSATQHLNF